MPIPLVGAVAAAQAAIGGVQAISGLFGKSAAEKEYAAALKDRKAFKTPEELFKILNLTENAASTGYDAATLSYLTNENDRAFSAALNTNQRLGGDPNSASALLDVTVQNILKTAGNDQQLRMQKMSQYIGASEAVANAATAEYVSEQDIVKDRLQSANANKAAATQSIGNGLNTILGAASSYATSQLYKDPATVENNFKRAVTGTGQGAYTTGNPDPTAPPPTITKNGRTYTWNPYTKNYE